MGFTVRPEELAGYGNMMDELSHPIYEVVETIGLHIGVPLEGVLGEALTEPMRTASSKLSSMTMDRVVTANSVKMNLNAVAWQYWNDENGNAKKFERPGDEQTEPMPGAVSYPVRYPELDVPDSELKSPEEIAEDIDGLAGAINDICEFVGDSPVSHLLTNLLSDWRALDRAGIALQQTGDRFDHVRDDVRDNLEKLLGQWEGDAADAFRDYMTRYANAVEDQAAVHRLLGECYRLTAEAIQAVAAKAVAAVTQKFNEFLGDRWWKFLLKWGLRLVPGLGQIVTVAQATEMLTSIVNALTAAREELDAFLEALREDAIKGAVAFLEGQGEQAKKGIEFMKQSKEFYDRVERVAEKVGDTADKVKDFAEEAAHTAGVADDLIRLTADTPDGLHQAPADAYSAGDTKAQRRKDTR
jgi:uncharacterized protein YukE